MKHKRAVAKRAFLHLSVISILFFILITPARAPHGGKQSLGGRTIASVQEEEFDRTLYKYQFCYGLRFSGDRATQERRRTCKAILVHKVEEVLQRKPGSYFKESLDFQCEDTAMGPQRRSANELGIVSLRPNKELGVLEEVLSNNVESVEVSKELEERAMDVCNFMVGCKMAMRALSIRKLASCFAENDRYKRRVILDSVGQLIFRAKAERGRIVPELLHGD